jgi:indolepyruvate ferredoxin oxidoreductase
MAANVLLLGYACQVGAVPVSVDALERAIRLNGVAVDANLKALTLGRLAAHAPDRIAGKLDGADVSPASLDEMTAFLTDYQNAAYAARLTDLAETVARAERDNAPGLTGLAYEVARLHADPAFRQNIARRFAGDVTVRYHLAPPFLDRGQKPRKRAFGPWMATAFQVLRRFKGLRGTALDPFGRSAERRTERRLIADYDRTIRAMLPSLSHDNHALAKEIAEVPQSVRGYGHVKEKAVAAYEARLAELLAQYRNPASAADAAE